MEYSTLVVETDDDGITTLTVSRPPARNALSGRVLAELAHFLSGHTTTHHTTTRHTTTHPPPPNTPPPATPPPNTPPPATPPPAWS
nr:hypothetical protein GCM10017745_41490 [Saccharothrix mutabilis subsp. capreolus]